MADPAETGIDPNQPPVFTTPTVPPVDLVANPDGTWGQPDDYDRLRRAYARNAGVPDTEKLPVRPEKWLKEIETERINRTALNTQNDMPSDLDLAMLRYVPLPQAGPFTPKEYGPPLKSNPATGTFMEGLAAGFTKDTLLGNFLEHQERKSQIERAMGPIKPREGYNVWLDPQTAPEAVRAQMWRLIGSQSEQETSLRLLQYNERSWDEMAAAQGGTAYTLGRLAGGFSDPSLFLTSELGLSAKTILSMRAAGHAPIWGRIARGIEIGGINAAQVLGIEAARNAMDPSYASEGLADMMTLAGAIGFGVGVFTRGSAHVLGLADPANALRWDGHGNYQKLLRSAPDHPLIMDPYSGGFTGKTGDMVSAGAAATPYMAASMYRDALEGEGLKSIFGLEKFGLTPVIRGLASESFIVRQFMSEAADLGGLKQNKNVWNSMTGQQKTAFPVEAEVAVRWKAKASETEEGIRSDWLIARGQTSEQLSKEMLPFMKEQLKSWLSKDGNLTFNQFLERAAKAVANGNVDLVQDAFSPFVEKSAKRGDAYFKELSKHAQETGLFKQAWDRQIKETRMELAATIKRGGEERRIAQLEARLDKMIKLSEHGPQVNTGPNYYPRMYRHDQIVANEADWSAKLERYFVRGGMSADEARVAAQAATSEITHSNFRPIHEDNEALIKSAADPSSVKFRTLEIPDSEIADYLDWDLIGAIRHQTATLAPSIELMRRWGDPSLKDLLGEIQGEYEGLIAAERNGTKRVALQNEMKQALEDVQAVRDRLLNVAGASKDPHSWNERTIRMVKHYTAWTTLGLSAVSQLGDLFRPAITEGLDAVHRYGFLTLIDASRAEIMRMAQRERMMAGDANELATGAAALAFSNIGDTYNSRSRLERQANQLSGAYFMLNGLTATTDLTKRWGGLIVQGNLNHEIMEIARTLRTQLDFSSIGDAGTIQMRATTRWGGALIGDDVAAAAPNYNTAQLKDLIRTAESGLARLPTNDPRVQQLHDNIGLWQQQLDSRRTQAAPRPTNLPDDVPSLLYRGHGRSDPGEPYGRVKYPIAGEADYYSFDVRHAASFGPDVTTHEIGDTLKNPLIIRSDADWNAITKEAGWENPNPARMIKPDMEAMTKKLQEVVRAKGHDGIVVHYSKADVDIETLPAEKSTNDINKIFGEPQAIAFKPESAGPVTRRDFSIWQRGNNLVDEDGNPVTMGFHGTNKAYDEMEGRLTGKRGGTTGGGDLYWFTNDADQASTYATEDRSLIKRLFGGGQAPNIRPTYIKAENPVNITEALIREMQAHPAYQMAPTTLLHHAMNERIKNVAMKKLFAEARSRGYDAAMIDSVDNFGRPPSPDDKPTRSFVIFDKKNIKNLDERYEALPPNIQPQLKHRADFDEWNGTNKLSEADGSPLMGFHGTKQFYPNFSSEKLGSHTGGVATEHGHFLAATPEAANFYALYTQEGRFDPIPRRTLRQFLNRERPTDDSMLYAGAPQVRPTYIRMENPKIMKEGQISDIGAEGSGQRIIDENGQLWISKDGQWHAFSETKTEIPKFATRKEQEAFMARGLETISEHGGMMPSHYVERQALDLEPRTTVRAPWGDRQYPLDSEVAAAKAAGHDGLVFQPDRPVGKGYDPEATYLVFDEKNLKGFDERWDVSGADKKPLPLELPEFREFMVGNWIKDGEGNALLVYHGTSAVYDRHSNDMLGSNTGAKSAQMGHFFAGNPKTAGNRAYVGEMADDPKDPRSFFEKIMGRKWTPEDDPYADSPNMRPSYIRMTNPHIVDDLAGDGTISAHAKIAHRYDQIAERGGILSDSTGKKWFAYEDKWYPAEGSTRVASPHPDMSGWSEMKKNNWLLNNSFAPGEIDELGPVLLRKPAEGAEGVDTIQLSPRPGQRNLTYPEVIEDAKVRGHDGVIIRNTRDGGDADTIYIVFDPATQIRNFDERWDVGKAEAVRRTSIEGTAAGQQVLEAQAREQTLMPSRPPRNIPTQMMERLHSLSIDAHDILAIDEMLQKHGKGFKSIHMANSDEWTDKDAQMLYRGMIGRALNRTVVTPGVMDRPTWMTTSMGSLIGQFKTFGVSSMIRTLGAGLQDNDRQFWTGAATLVGSGVLLNELRNQLFYDRSSFNQPFLGILADGLDRSGILGSLMDVNNAIETVTNNKAGLRPLVGAGKDMPVSPSKFASTFFGPAAGKVVDAGKTIGEIVSGSADARTWRDMRGFLPGQNLPYIDPIADRIFPKPPPRERKKQGSPAPSVTEQVI